MGFCAASVGAEKLLFYSKNYPVLNAIYQSQPVSNSSRIQQLVERQAEAWLTGDVDKIIADFAEDCVFVVASSRLRGKWEVRRSVEDFFASNAVVNIEITRIVEGGEGGVVEWSWTEVNRETGGRSYAEDGIIFALENGKIKYWREYIDHFDRPPSNSGKSD